MVRSFEDTPIERARVEALLRLALRGPSAGNTQALRFLVLDGPEIEHYWATTLDADRRASFPWPGLLVAPVLVLPYVEPSRYPERYREADKAETGLGAGEDSWTVPYWWVDGGAAVQTLLLAAVADGLGACLFGQFDHEPAVRARFGVPDSMRALGTVAIGYPADDDRPSRSSRRPRRAEDVTVQWNRWVEASTRHT